MKNNTILITEQMIKNLFLPEHRSILCSGKSSNNQFKTLELNTTLSDQYKLHSLFGIYENFQLIYLTSDLSEATKIYQNL